MKIVDKIKRDTGNSCDIIYKKIIINNKEINLIFSEVLSSGDYINEYIIEALVDLKIAKVDFSLMNIKNYLTSNNIVEIYTYKEMLDYLFKGFCILLTNDCILGIEAKNDIDRSIPTSDVEVSILGPKDSFNEKFNDNIALIRKRLRTNELFIESLNIGTLSKTKVGICYMNNIVEENLVQDVKKKLDSVNIDGIIDSSYLRKYLSNSLIFPTINVTERPDICSQALLEGKVVIIVDNSPLALVLPTFFIDFFHTPDDYYEKNTNITFIRLLRLIAFFIAVFLPGIYISLTTHNIDMIPSSLLYNLINQRLSVPFPSFVECILLLLAFEILRETDLRIPSKLGSSISILGGLILGEAAVTAGIVSPIMIIVVAISSISGLIFSNISIIYLVRFLRLVTVFLGTFLGFFGIFLSFLLIIIKLGSLESLGYPYTYPFAPLYKKELSDSIIKYNTNPKYRNLLLAKKNKIRGR